MAWNDEMIPADLTVEHKGSVIPLREHEFVKSAPDFNTFLKNSFEAHSEVGRRIPLPKDDAGKVKWKEQHLPRLIEAGLVDAPTKLPDNYEIALPDEIPSEAWTDEDTKIATEFGKKFGLSQDALNAGVSLVAGIMSKHGQAVKVDREASQTKIAEWAKSEGLTVEDVNAALDRFNRDPNGWDEATAEAISKSGFADNPLVVKALVKLMRDSGTFDTRNDGGANSDTQAFNVKEEIDQIRTNPAHPMHERYMNNDDKVVTHVQELYKKYTALLTKKSA